MVAVLEWLNGVVWGIPTLFLFLGSGLWFSIQTCWIQFRRFGRSFRAIRDDLKSPQNGKSTSVSTSAALLTSLAAVMGPGNLVGVSSAILSGGPGAVFWMWISAFLGMATRYAESTLSVLHRRTGENGNYGGPMYVMRDSGNRRCAVVFAIAGVAISLTMANALPSGAIGSALYDAYGIPTILTGAILSLFVLSAVTGGVKRICKVTGVLVPAVCILFLGASLWITFTHPTLFMAAVKRIFSEAFSLRAGVGGLLGGAIRYGMARGIYSNEAGMGTDPILAASTDERSAHRQGLISMAGPFLDTVVFCSMTAFVVVMADISGADPSDAVTLAFTRFLPYSGRLIVILTMALLVMATLAGWICYGEACLQYLTNRRWIRSAYHAVYTLLPVFCAGAELGILFTLTDLCTALMAIPNVILCIKLLPEVKIELRNHDSL